MQLDQDIKGIIDLVQAHVEAEEYKGWDPFDGLNSKLFQKLPIRNNRLARLAWIQLFKRSPINLRRIAAVPKGYNNKGLGLFLTGYCNLYKQTNDKKYLEKISFLAKLIIQNQNNNYSGACWGYNFDWQARAFFQPNNTPTVVASTYIGYALADAYDILGDKTLLDTVISIGNFILTDLNRTYDNDGDFSFSYSPLDSTSVFNASLLGSRMLARIYHYTKNEDLITEARKSINYCVKHQQKDGAWAYGTLPFHQWVDSFHTGFNLECINDFQNYTGDTSYQKYIDIGLDYYINNFFTAEGIPKYYNNQTYPVDIHAPAQLIITLCKLNVAEQNQELINRVLNWTIKNMMDKAGYFYYRVNKFAKNKIQYIRWSQAWIYCALTFLPINQDKK